MAVPQETVPDFGQLFAACSCGEDEACPRCAITPRTAAALHTALVLDADTLYDDLERLDGRPITAEQLPGLTLIPEYPAFTWPQPWEWWRQAARCYDDLAADLTRGQLPFARCPGEEIAIILAVALAADLVADGMLDETVSPLPAAVLDYNWVDLQAGCLQDLEMAFIMNPGALPSEDGLPVPTDMMVNIDDYHPEHWFGRWSNLDPADYPERDPARGFRRPVATGLPTPR